MTDDRMKDLEQAAREQTYYPVHLSEVNKKNNVTATRDIFTEQGILVAPKGTPIDGATAERILRFRLVEPLVEMVRLEKSMSLRDLGREFILTIDSFPDAEELHKACRFQKELDRLVESYLIDPVLLQELTILRERLPRHFQKTLFCTWLSALIASELGVGEDISNEVFLAGLSHDIGFLHISEDILRDIRALDPPRWRAIQSHVVIGSLLLKKLYGEGSPAAKAVLEHHERCDGSGYPVGMTDGHLDVTGQITAIADIIQAVRIDKFSACGRSLSDFVPLLLMNSDSHLREIRDAVYSILTRCGVASFRPRPSADAGPLIEHLLSGGVRLRKAASLLGEIDIAGPVTVETGGRRIERILNPVRSMVASSGLVSDDIIGWLENLRSKPSDAPLAELAQMELMQGELGWQLEKICRAFDQYLAIDGSSDPRMTQLADVSKRISGCLSGLA